MAAEKEAEEESFDKQDEDEKEEEDDGDGEELEDAAAYSVDDTRERGAIFNSTLSFVSLISRPFSAAIALIASSK